MRYRFEGCYDPTVYADLHQANDLHRHQKSSQFDAIGRNNDGVCAFFLERERAKGSSEIHKTVGTESNCLWRQALQDLSVWIVNYDHALTRLAACARPDGHAQRESSWQTIDGNSCEDADN